MSGPVLVLGGPGTGKSTLLVDIAVHRINGGTLEASEVLLLAPTRASASRLRDDLTDKLSRSLSTAPARTWASYAFDLIRRAKAEGRMPELRRAPRLLSGAEQDLIIKELLTGHGKDGAPVIDWPQNLALALGTRGFRQEIRELFDRVSEYGASAEQLQQWGYRFDRPDWVAASALYGEYRDVLDLRMPEAFDPAGILGAARALLELDEEFLAQERRRVKLILVDDYQEANPAIHALLGLLSTGRDAVITSCPDTAVQGFRGARPELTGQLEQLLSPGTDLASVVLPASHTLTAPLAEAWRNVASRISTAGVASGYRMLAPRAVALSDAMSDAPALQHTTDGPAQPASGTGPSVASHLVDSVFHEQRYIVQRILEAHLFGGRSFDDVVVIVRNGAQVNTVQRFLAAQGIPVNVPASETAIRDEPAVRPLLDIFSVVVGDRTLDPELGVSLLTSRIGGAGTLELRRLRQVLRQRELQDGGGRMSDELLVDLLTEPLAVSGLGREAAPARRIARMIQAGKVALAAPSADPETVLWELWAASGLSDKWSAAALGEGQGSVRADRDLDAMLALFQTAERFVDQMPGAAPQLFLEYLLSQELPMDTLAVRARRRASVSVLTPASAAGRHWPFVIVAGLQEGIWPNLRLRGELLGSGELQALLDHGASFRQHRQPLSLLQDIRFDELRTFSTAVSRASEELICCAVSSADDQPSQFLDLVDPLPPGITERPRTEVLRPLTLRALVAELRKFAQDPANPALAAEAVQHLGRMAARTPGIPGADPSQWWGLLPLSTNRPIVPPDAPIPVSPSKVDAVLTSPLSWFVAAAGGEKATDFARSLGTLVHAIAQDMPEATGTEYIAELERRWPTLGMKDTWEGKADLRRAESMVRKLAAYVILGRQSGRKLLATEVDFEVDLPFEEEGHERIARLRGQIDRLEEDSKGRAVIVDLKTGKSAPAKKDIEGHPQLAAYQVAVNEGALAGEGTADESGGASLVHLGTKNKGASVQEQPPLDPSDGWARAMIEEAARLMSAASFETVHDPRRSGFGGSGCRLPEVCPLCAEGRQVTQ